MGWVEGQVLFSVPHERDTGGTGGLRHVAVETTHLKSEFVDQEQDYLLYLSAFENSPWSELNFRSE